jgi:formate hydrogenlyase subunit 4
MVFVGKFAYLVLFPGMLFIVLSGLAAGAVLSGVGTALAGNERRGGGPGITYLLHAARSECISTGGSLQAVTWIAPVVKLLALSWISCIVFGFIAGDLVLLYVLLLLASGCDVVVALLSGNPRARQAAWPEAASLISWAVPLALVLAALALRTGQATVSGLIAWQTTNGVMVAASAGGGAAQAGSVLALLAALASGIALARLRPLGRGYFSDAPAGILDDVSGPPLSFFIAGGTAALFVVPLVLVALFFAGPAGNWYEVVFWALKALGIFVLLALVDVVSARARASRVLLWGAGIAGALALAGFILIWTGVSR